MAKEGGASCPTTAVKLFVGATKAAKADGRSVVYPSDIHVAACAISENDAHCRQFYEGFQEDERLVIEAVGYLATKPEQYVSIAQIMELIQDKLSRDRVERALRNIIDLEMLETNRQNSNQYRFCVDIYRRYFRAQKEYSRAFPRNGGQDVNFHLMLR